MFELISLVLLIPILECKKFGGWDSLLYSNQYLSSFPFYSVIQTNYKLFYVRFFIPSFFRPLFNWSKQGLSLSLAWNTTLELLILSILHCDPNKLQIILLKFFFFFSFLQMFSAHFIADSNKALVYLSCGIQNWVYVLWITRIIIFISMKHKYYYVFYFILNAI